MGENKEVNGPGFGFHPPNTTDEESKRQFDAFLKAQRDGFAPIAHLGAESGLGAAFRRPLPASSPIQAYQNRIWRQKVTIFVVGFVFGLLVSALFR